MSCNVRKRAFWHIRPTKTPISLRIRAVWSKSSLSAWRNFASLAIKNAYRIFARRTCPKVRFWTLWLILFSRGRTCLKVRFLTLRLKWCLWEVECETFLNCKIPKDEIGRAKRNRVFEHAHNAQIQSILRVRKISSGILLSIHTFCTIQWFC